jgi:hypothetical protein
MSEDFYPAGLHPFHSLSASPSLHGGRGASPSEGGRPSDLSALAGGGRRSAFRLRAVPLGDAPGPVFASSGRKEGEDEKNVDHQESGDRGVHAPAAGSNPWLRPRLPRQLLHSWSAIPATFPDFGCMCGHGLWPMAHGR